MASAMGPCVAPPRLTRLSLRRGRNSLRLCSSGESVGLQAHEIGRAAVMASAMGPCVAPPRLTRLSLRRGRNSLRLCSSGESVGLQAHEIGQQQSWLQPWDLA